MNCNECKNYKPKGTEQPEQPRLPKIGDWIKLTHCTAMWGSCQPGDVLEVIALSIVGAGFWVRTSKHSKHGSSEADREIKPPFAYIGAGDTYEIVDQPKEANPTEPITTYQGKQYREVKREAKVGELVKVTTYCGGPVTNGTIWFVTRMCEDGRAYFKNDHDADKTAHLEAYVVLEPIAPVKQEQPKRNKPDRLKVGMKVRVRQWEDMVQEFGLDGDGDIKTTPCFIKRCMGDQCGKELVIKELTSSGHVFLNGFVYSANTLDLVEQPKRTYTAEQIREARDIVYRIMTRGRSVSIIYRIVCEREGWPIDKDDKANNGKPHTIAMVMNRIIGSGIFAPGKRAVAFCSDTDEWNDDVGRLVSLCKLTGEKLPKWVRGE